MLARYCLILPWFWDWIDLIFTSFLRRNTYFLTLLVWNHANNSVEAIQMGGAIVSTSSTKDEKCSSFFALLSTQKILLGGKWKIFTFFLESFFLFHFMKNKKQLLYVPVNSSTLFEGYISPSPLHINISAITVPAQFY